MEDYANPACQSCEERAADIDKRLVKHRDCLLIRKYEYLLLLFVFVLFLVTRLTNLKIVPIYVDEAQYIYWAQRALYYGNYHMAISFGTPPLHSLAMVPFLKVFSNPLVAARMLSVVFGAFSLTGITLIGKEFRNLRLGALAGLFWVVCPYVLWYERLGIIESMLLAFMVFAVYFAVRAALEVNSFYLIGTGICIGLALWTKLTAQLLFLVVPFAYVLRGPRQKAIEKKRPLLRWIFHVALSLLIGYGIFNLLRISSSFHKMVDLSHRHTKTLAQVVSNPFNDLFDHAFRILASLWKLMTFPLLILCILGIIVGVFKKWRPAYFLLIWFLTILIVEAIIVKRDAGSRYWVVLLPPLILGAGYAVLELPALAVNKVRSIGESGARKASMAAVAVMLAICVVAVAVPVVTCDAYSILRPDKYDRYSMTRWTWGWGYDEMMGEIAARSRNRKVRVLTGDGFSFLVLKSYQSARFQDDPNISVKQYKKANKFSDACREGYQVYFAVNQGTKEKLHSGIFMDVKKYPEKGHFIRDKREESTDKRFSMTLTFARVEMPFLGSIEPDNGPPGTTVTLRGGNFGTRKGAYAVKFGESYATGFSNWTENAIVTTVPLELSGMVEVGLDTGVEAPDRVPFMVTP